MSHKHFWELRQDEYIGTIVVQVDYQADEIRVKSEVESVFRNIGVGTLTVGIEKDVVAVY